jgi:hypothetical protein
MMQLRLTQFLVLVYSDNNGIDGHIPVINKRAFVIVFYGLNVAFFS